CPKICGDTYWRRAMIDEWEFPPLTPPFLTSHQCAEINRAWARERVELLKSRIKLVRRCRQFPAAKRPSEVDGYVYLVWSPSHCAHKVGSTNDLQTRLAALRRELADDDIKLCATYRTPIVPELLEKALHQHFSHGRSPVRGVSSELFEL